MRIGYLRPAVVTQAIISFDDEIQEPHDLVDRPVGVGAFSGQHYTTLQLLEGPLRREQLNVIGVQGLDDLLELAQRGDLAAVTIMEPFVSLALKRGGHIVSSMFYRGGQVFARRSPKRSSRLSPCGERRRRYRQRQPGTLPVVHYRGRPWRSVAR